MQNPFDIQNGILKRFQLVNSETEIIIPEGVTEIADNAFEDSYVKAIYGYTGSYAEAFANSHGFAFIPMDI